MDVFDNTLPGTAKSQPEQGEKGFSKIEVLLEATGGLSLSQVCVVTGLEASTIQNWVKRGWVAHPIGKRYEEIHIARILIINALKECIKLEHIAVLMTYLNGRAKDGSEAIIKESVLYNYLCEAMKRSGQMGDSSKGGVESVVEAVIKDYKSPDPDSRVKLRKTLTLMMYACVCTDVKRRTEAMMGQIIKELDEREPGSVKTKSSASARGSAAAQPAPRHATPAASAAAAHIAAPIKIAPEAPAPAPVAATPAAQPVPITPIAPTPAAAPAAAPAVAPTAPVAPAAPVTPAAPVATAPVQMQIETPITKPAAAKPAATPAATPATPPPVAPIRITLDDPEPNEELDEAAQTRKTISQALREWDISSVEKIIIDHDEESAADSAASTESKKPANRPWYIRKNNK